MSTPRRRRKLPWRNILAIAAVIVIGVCIAEALRGFPTFRPASESATVARPDDAVPLTVRYVSDGDTLRAQAETPGDLVSTTEPIRIRLIGIDTPEGTPEPECGADAARDQLRELLPEGATAWVSPDRDSWDDYDRRLFYVWTDDGRFVNLELLRSGHAEAIHIAPNTRHADLFEATASAARAAGAGNWGTC